MSSVDALIREVTIAGRHGSTCNEHLADGPWVFDVPHQPATVYGPGASQDDAAPPASPTQGPIPDDVRRATASELEARTRAAKEALGHRLVILGHHYQRDEVIRWADFRGDSFKLAQLSQTRPEAEFIVFCGVHFMAETADLLSRPHQRVVLPNLAAGCSMADMADIDSVTECWEQLSETYGDERGLVPVTYMNSAAALKAFCGERGGIVCTSSNARRVLEWAFERGHRVLFFPDQHLGRNTGKAMGIPLERMPVWDPRLPLGGHDDGVLRRARIVLWKGWCSVHRRFTPSQVLEARRDHPGVRVMVHPECPMEVVDLADEVGSTEQIITAVAQAPAGSRWAIGTEINLVRRLAAENPGKTVFCLDPVICPCSTMYRIHPAYLAWALENLATGRVVNEVRVDAAVRQWSRIALERMLAVP